MKTLLGRLGTATALVAGILGVVAFPAGGSTAKPAQEYVVRPDPRLCPSPFCGGYWIALANRVRTRCHDGRYRPRCYVSSAWPASRTIHDGALVQGGIAVREVPGSGSFGTLIATDVRNPVGAIASGSFYRLRDIGLRCVRAPCFSIRAFRLNSRGTATVSELDLKSAEVAPDQGRSATAALADDGLFAAGRIVSTEDGGRVFRASRIYLRGANPRA